MFEALADEGHSEAEFFVGFMFDTGKGVKARPGTEAAKWYRMAADHGHAMALNNLADLYLNGRGVSRDVDRAVALYQKAARGGDPVAQTNSGPNSTCTAEACRASPPRRSPGSDKAAAAGLWPGHVLSGADAAPRLGHAGGPGDKRGSWFGKAADAGSKQAERALEELE